MFHLASGEKKILRLRSTSDLHKCFNCRHAQCPLANHATDDRTSLKSANVPSCTTHRLTWKYPLVHMEKFTMFGQHRVANPHIVILTHVISTFESEWVRPACQKAAFSGRRQAIYIYIYHVHHFSVNQINSSIID